MKVLVIGAGGKTGRHVVEKALAAGHEVTVLVHALPGEESGQKEAHAFPSKVQVFHGDVRNPTKLEQAMEHQQAVIDCIGGSKPFLTTDLETSAAKVVVEVMKRQDVKRLIVVSALGEGESRANTGFFYEHVLMPVFLQGIVEDKKHMEEVVTASGLDFTIVRPPILSDSEHVGELHVVARQETVHRISRVDLAGFLVEQLVDRSYVGRAVTVTGT
jgi:putative NADH-flavin reductase